MDLNGKVAVITGGAGGIGRAVARKFAARGAKLAIADLSFEKAKEVADEVGGIAFGCDVSSENEIQSLVAEVEDQIGPIDLFFSNAGIARGEPDHAASASNETWQLNWDVHVMAHVYAARVLLPKMIERGDGYLLQMASAAGLLSQIADAAYTATKHAAMAFAESLAITHLDDGIKVSVICPQYVATNMTGYEGDVKETRQERTITAEEAAQTILEGVENETFLILTHPEVAEYYKFRAAEPDKWMSGMRKRRQMIIETVGSTDSKAMQILV